MATKPTYKAVSIDMPIEELELAVRHNLTNVSLKWEIVNHIATSKINATNKKLQDAKTVLDTKVLKHTLMEADEATATNLIDAKAAVRLASNSVDGASVVAKRDLTEVISEIERERQTMELLLGVTVSVTGDPKIITTKPNLSRMVKGLQAKIQHDSDIIDVYVARLRQKYNLDHGLTVTTERNRQYLGGVNRNV